MDGHTNTQFVDVWPFLGRQPALHGQGALQWLGFALIKDDHHAVAGVFDVLSPTGFETMHEDLIMAIQDIAHDLAMFFPELGRTLDIGI
jgi:hypothetical protein